jgi:hypothetical protein
VELPATLKIAAARHIDLVTPAEALSLRKKPIRFDFRVDPARGLRLLAPRRWESASLRSLLAKIAGPQNLPPAGPSVIGMFEGMGSA